MYSNKKIARVAGLLYLTVILCGVFAEFFVRAKLFVPNNTIVTANNIIASEWLFRLGFVSDLMMQTAYFFLPFALYILLKHVNKNHALLMVACVMIAVSIMCVNMINHIAPLLLLTKTVYTSAFDPKQLHGLVSFFLELHGNGYHIAQIFFGLWLFPLGYLVFKSGFFPKFLGVLLMIGCFGYLIDFLLFFLSPNLAEEISMVATIPADIGELLFCLWLLIKGVKNQQVPETQLG
jgi:Domain of unknown function (DUF4386)